MSIFTLNKLIIKMLIWFNLSTLKNANDSDALFFYYLICYSDGFRDMVTDILLAD